MVSEQKSNSKVFVLRLLLLPVCIAFGQMILQDVSAIEKNASPPNIILVMADDQGWGDMAYNGHPDLVTPNFDKMAAAGLRMDRFYAAAPVCSPTRASVLTGRHPNRMGVFKWGYPMRPQELTLPEILQEHGYATGHFGKWHLGSVRKGSPAHPGANGFDEWISAPNFYENDPVLSRQGVAESFQGESSVLTMKLAIEFMKKSVEKEKPFFAVVWFGSPHGPHIASEEDKKHYSKLSKNKQNFLGEVTGMDRAIGDLQIALDEMKIKDNTFVWYTSDNGALPKVGSTGGFRGNKGKVYEGGLLVPSIIQWPTRIKQHRVTDYRGNTCDILPTVLAVAGIKHDLKHPLDGISLLPLVENKKMPTQRRMGFWDYTIRGQSVPATKMMKDLLKAQQAGGDLKPNEISMRAAELPKSPLFDGHRYPGHSAWIQGDWKLHRIQPRQGEVRFELYHLKSDRFETKNVFDKNPEKAKELNSELHKWLESVADSFNGADYAK